MKSRLLLVPFFVFAFLPMAFGQFQGAVQGTVTDASGATVPDATVTLTSVETQRALTTQTSTDGNYRFNGLAPGNYSVSATKAGFQAQTVDNIHVNQEVQGTNLTLTTGNVSESVTVSASELPALTTENADITSNITQQEVRDLPQFGRDPYALLRLTPGIFGDEARSSSGQAVNLVNTTGPGGSNSSIFQTENQVPISANGQRVENNNFEIDGVSVNSLGYGGAAVITPNQESVKEINVSSSAYTAQYGRNSGAQINVISQNGTDQFHGTGVFKYNDPLFNAYDKFAGIGLPETRVDQYLRQFAGSIGGPIVKNHLFFFFSYEGLRNNTTSFESQWVETPQFLSAIQSQRAGTAVATALGAPGGTPRIISTSAQPCPSALTPCQEVSGGLDLGSITGKYGQYTTTSGGGLDGIPDVMFAQIALPQTLQGNQYNGRLDYSHGNDSFMGSFYLTMLNNTSASTAGGRPNQDVPFKPVTELITFNYNRIFTPTILNEARVNFTRFSDNGLTDSPNTQWGIPLIDVQNYGPLGNDVQFGAPQGGTTPGIFAENTYEARDTVSAVVGKQSFKFGVEYRWEQNNNNLLGGARPVYAFQGLFNLANGAPVYEGINADPITGAPTADQRYYRTTDFAQFAQDDIKLRSNLTLNLGLRWEYFSPLSETRGKLSNIFYGSEGLLNATVQEVPGQLYKPDKNNFAPRVALAYSPFPKMVIRTGFGIYYNRIPEVLLANNAGNPPFFASYGLCCGTASNPFAGGTIQFNTGATNNPASYPVNPALAQGLNQYGVPNAGAVQVYGAQTNSMPNSYAYIYSFDVQYQLPWSLVADVAYSGSADRKLIRLVNENYFYPANTATGFAAVYIPQPDVDSNFNALLATLSKRASHGLTFTGNFRYSKSLDNLSYDGPGFVTNQTYPLDNHTEYGPSDFDTKYNFTGAAVWEIPFTRAKTGWMKEVLGGWTLSPIVTYHTGFPWTAVTGQSLPTPSGYSLGPLRPIAYYGGAGTSDSNSTFLSPGGNFPNTATSGQPYSGGEAYFDITPGFPPGIGRNTFRGPRYFSTDLSIAKVTKVPYFHLGEAAAVDIRANMYNVFNQLNLSPFGFDSPSTNIQNVDFGRATAGLAGRVVEFQVRLSF